MAMPAVALDARYLAGGCTSCHGTDGRSVGAMPRLAGIDAGFFVKQMKAFKDGSLTGTVMNQLAKGYTDEQIAVLADFFSRQKAD
jgi:cytochrome subunit of sulfide dehydrogenase